MMIVLKISHVRKIVKNVKILKYAKNVKMVTFWKMEFASNIVQMVIKYLLQEKNV